MHLRLEDDCALSVRLCARPAPGGEAYGATVMVPVIDGWMRQI